MQLSVVAVGKKMPDWVQAGVHEYDKRMPRELSVDWREVAPAPRQQSSSVTHFQDIEAEAIQRQLRGTTVVVALDVTGRLVTTEDIAAALADWQMQGDRVALVIGGPDGLQPTLLASARQRWSLGRVTLPHPLVRIVLAEQLYRAWSINARHPYHRA